MKGRRIENGFGLGFFLFLLFSADHGSLSSLITQSETEVSLRFVRLHYKNGQVQPHSDCFDYIKTKLGGESQRENF